MNSKEIICTIEESIEYVRRFFWNDEELISLYISVQEEMWKCDPDLMFCYRNGLIGLAKREEKYRFFIAPSEDAYDIKFAHMETKIPFLITNAKQFINECEKCVFHILMNPDSILNAVPVDDELDDTAVDSVLNRNQKKFCKRPSTKNIRLLAPAGSGKTYSLLWRCKYIADDYKKKRKVPPYFLILTFTKAACVELEERIRTNPEFRNIRATVRTLNAWGWEQIKVSNRMLITNRFERAKLVIHDLNKVLQKYPNIAALVKSTRKKQANAELIMDMIDLLKSLGFNHKMTKAEYRAHRKILKEVGLISILEESYQKLHILLATDLNDKKEASKVEDEFFVFWKKAVVNLEENLKYTMEDQKYWALQNINANIEQKKFPKGVTKYSHILIDEFQDINPLDMSLINAVSTYHGGGKKISMTIVGDDDQAIFGWRGTTPKYILYPEKYMGVPFETIVLNENYRSPRSIVELSGKLIVHNKGREPKELKSKAPGKALIKVVRRQKYVTAVDVTMKTLKDLIEIKGCNSVALIGRRQVSLFPYQILLSADGASYSVDGDLDIFAGEAMESLMDIIKIVYRAKDSDNDSVCAELVQVCKKVARYPMSKPEEKKLVSYLEAQYPENFIEALEYIKDYPNIVKNHNFEEIYEIVSKLVSSETVYEFMSCIVEDFEGFFKDYNKAEEEVFYKEPQFFRLKDISKKYSSDFRAFWRDLDRAKRNVGAEESKITLVTATRSKGHEYDAAIILDCYDYEWPNVLSEDIEEERRLMYVAVTRAKKYLYFISASDEQESRFLEEMELV